MAYYAYILFSESTAKYVVGCTPNLEVRLAELNSGESRPLATGMPWAVVWKQDCTNRGAALQLEAKIKMQGAARFLKQL